MPSWAARMQTLRSGVVVVAASQRRAGSASVNHERRMFVSVSAPQAADHRSAALATRTPGQRGAASLVHADGAKTTVSVTLGEYMGRT